MSGSENVANETAAESSAGAEVESQPPSSPSPVPAGISGRVFYSGTLSQDRIELPKSAQACGTEELEDDSLLLGPRDEILPKLRALQNAVIWIEAGHPASTPPGEEREEKVVEINQLSCRFLPRVAAIQTSDTLSFRNSDSTLHTVRLERDGEFLWKRAMPIPGQSLRRKIDKPGLLSAFCDAGHPWAKAHIHVFEHPWFALSQSDGSFALPPLPDGSYTLMVWHESLGTMRKELKLSGSIHKRLVFEEGQSIEKTGGMEEKGKDAERGEGGDDETEEK